MEDNSLAQSVGTLQRNSASHCSWLDTPLGLFQARWSAQGLWSFHGVRAAEMVGEPSSDSLPRQVQERELYLRTAICEYFRTGSLPWNLEWLDWAGVSPFQRESLEACWKIPKGTVLTYGQLAALLKRPGGARAVGMALARNRWPLIIPCHRVIGCGGDLRGYSGVGGVRTKRTLLEWEGVPSVGGGTYLDSATF